MSHGAPANAGWLLRLWNQKTSRRRQDGAESIAIGTVVQDYERQLDMIEAEMDRRS
jgi:hypothetical protein